ncbi:MULTISPECIES: DUF6221 family protein [Streptomyces]|uniref:DUF6221 family protein n=1 Tax=Streptomyces TaxID=1883 RepID=UPI00345BFFA5
MTADLVAFLHARLDEDEATQKGLNDWHAVDCESLPDGYRITFGCDCGVPARMLAEVEAKRKILSDLEKAEFSLSCAGIGTRPHDLLTGAVNSLRRVARLLALPYADHPDYREEWRP